MTRIAIDICLCTFRRPHVETTLRSLANLITQPEWAIRVIIADNDETPSAEELIRETSESTGLDVLYIHAPARNISIARNACLDAATAPYIAFLDDDEIATPEWLMVLLSTLTSAQTDIVLGPVRALYAPDAPKWMKQGDFHATLPVWVNQQIITGYTCNVIMRKDAVGSLRFRPELGRSGGEDTAFFATLHSMGHRISFAPEAWLTETVPPDRARLMWLLKRRFRSGQTHALLLQEANKSPLAHIKQCVRASIKMLVCFAIAIATVLNPTRSRFWLLRGSVHLGVVSRLLGKQDLTQYG